jgi:hypothetical protein
MTFPTPTGAPPSAGAVTGQGQLVAGWQNLPTTDASEAYTVQLVTQKYGATIGAQFKQWYDGARQQDPAITPSQAVAAFLLGDTTSVGLAKVANLLTGEPATVTAGTGSQAVNLGTQDWSVGVIQAAVNAASNLGWPGFIIAIEQIWAQLTDGKMWRSLGWLLLGVVLILSGTFSYVRSTGPPPALPFGISVK